MLPTAGICKSCMIPSVIGFLEIHKLHKERHCLNTLHQTMNFCWLNYPITRIIKYLEFSCILDSRNKKNHSYL